MYDRFVELYDFIFPYKPAQKEFVLRHSTGRESYLDIGCSTGALAANLRGDFSNLTAMDYSNSMIAKAKDQYGEINFQVGDMRKMDTIPLLQYDCITCFGNTLVHLSSLEEIKNLFTYLNTQLNDSGALQFQIVNYDRILQDRPNGLPTIENEKIRFVRNYTYDSLPHVLFSTELLDKESGETVTGEVPLFALESKTVLELLKKSGFSDVQFFGSFNDDDFTDESFPLVVVARK